MGKHGLQAIAVVMLSVLNPMRVAHAHEVHVYRNFDQAAAPGLVLPSGPDDIVQLILDCPASSLPGMKLVLPSGATESRYAVSALSGPLYHFLVLTLSQDYAVSPTRILWRLSFGDVGLSGYIGPSDDLETTFIGPDCATSWKLSLISTPMSGAYSPDESKGITSTMKPFADE